MTLAPSVDLARFLPHEAPAEASAVHRLPACPAAYLLLAADDRTILLATTQNLRRAVAARINHVPQAPTRRADVAAITHLIRWRVVHSPFEARWRHYQVARVLYPDRYRDQVGFGPAYYLAVDWTQPIPEITVTSRIWAGPGDWVGPWADARGAQQALEGLWDLFDLCRFPSELRRAPAGVRCAYAGMGRCDAPCDSPAVIPTYLERTRQAWTFACGDADAWHAAAQLRMTEFSRRHEFERAAQVKQQLAFASHWQHEWAGIALPAQQQCFLLALPVTRRRCWSFFSFERGAVVSGPTLPQRDLTATLADWLNRGDAGHIDCDPTTRMEQSWLWSRFVHHAEAQSAAVVALTGVDPLEAAARIAARIAELSARRATRKPPAPTASPGDDAVPGRKSASPTVHASMSTPPFDRASSSGHGASSPDDARP